MTEQQATAIRETHMQQNYDVQALLDLHRSIFGDTRMEGDGDGGGDGGAGDGDGGQGDGWKPPTSQAELDRIIADRVNRTKSQFKDYNDLKSKAARLDALEAASQTDAERVQKAIEAAERTSAMATERAVKSEIRAIATGEFADPTDAYLFLGDLNRFVNDSGDVDSAAIESALKELEKAKPHLVTRTRTDVGVGVRTSSTTPSMNDLIRSQRSTR